MIVGVYGGERLLYCRGGEERLEIGYPKEGIGDPSRHLGACQTFRFLL